MDINEVCFWHRTVLFGVKCKKLVSLEWASVPDSSPRRYLFFVRLVIDTFEHPQVCGLKSCLCIKQSISAFLSLPLLKMWC